MMNFIILILTVIFFSPGAFAAEIPYIENAPEFNRAVSEISDGSFNINIKGLIQKAIDLFTNEIHENTECIVIFLIIGAISSVINLLEFKDKSANDAAFFACFTLCAGVVLKIFFNILEYATSVIDSLADFITKISPILTTLIITSGKPVSASAFHPVLATSVFVITLIVKKCIIPLSVYSSVMNIANNINAQVQISSFCRLISSVSKWILTLAFTLFTGICTIYGFSAPSLDVLSAKTAKFAVGSLVPVVGRFLSDTLDTVISASLMMKNAVGGASLFALCSICAIPVMKIMVMLFTLKLSAAIIEPVTDKRICKLLLDMSETVTVIFAMVMTVLVLFIICISIILAATN